MRTSLLGFNYVLQIQDSTGQMAVSSSCSSLIPLWPYVAFSDFRCMNLCYFKSEIYSDVSSSLRSISHSRRLPPSGSTWRRIWWSSWRWTWWFTWRGSTVKGYRLVGLLANCYRNLTVEDSVSECNVDILRPTTKRSTVVAI